MNEKLEQFRKEFNNKTPKELEQGYDNFIKSIHNLPIDYEESMKTLAKIRGKDEDHYFRNTTEEENEAERKALEKLSTPTGIKLFEDNNDDGDMQINVGSILLVNKDGFNEEYQVLDNSEINPEYPFALLDIKRHRIVQTSVSLDYMNFGHYIYIDKEYEIINIR